MAGKTIDELILTNRPRATPDARAMDWHLFVEKIDDLLATGHATFAEETLTGIRETVLQRQTVSDRQRRAVQNIAAAAARRPERGVSRRYEGWHR